MKPGDICIVQGSKQTFLNGRIIVIIGNEWGGYFRIKFLGNPPEGHAAEAIAHKGVLVAHNPGRQRSISTYRTHATFAPFVNPTDGIGHRVVFR